MKGFARIVWVYDRAIVTLVFVAFSVMLLAALIGTVTRYFTFLPGISWGEEVTRFAGIWAVFLVAGVCVRHGAHLGVDLLTRKLSRRAQRCVALFVCFEIAAFSALLVFYGLEIALDNMTQYSAALQWPMGLVYLCIPIGGALMIIETIAVVARTLRGEEGYLPPIVDVVE